MRIKDAWRYLDWDYVCDQAPEVRLKYERDTFGNECVDGWYQYINFTDGLSELIQKWWDSLSRTERRELLKNRRQAILQQANGLQRALDAE
jgi:hypothetical protein